MTDDVTTLFALGLGPWLCCLRGKIPVQDGWNTLPPVDEATVRGWIETGYNLGLRTGSRSGVIVIDDDQAKHGASGYVAPPTGLSTDTPTGGKHYFYVAPSPCPGNSASKLAPYVDVRGEGGQVVVPPSIHPTARTAYRFASVGEPGVFPVEAAKLQPTTAKSPVTTDAYIAKAIASEIHRVRTSTEGTRNNNLNVAALKLGHYVGSGTLSEAQVRDDLISAAMLVGLPESEARATVASGMRAGMREPKRVPERVERTTTATQAPPTRREKPETLIPGSHVLPGGEYVEQGTDTFSAEVLANIAPGLLYRRSNLLGAINDGVFEPTPPHRLRTVVDASTKLISSAMKDDEPTTAFRTCSRDLAQLVLEFGALHGDVRILKHLAHHPVYLGQNFDLAKPGWNPNDGVFLTCLSVPAPLDLATSRAVLDDLIADFPFEAPSDRANFLGLMLTPLLRPAIDEPVPMHLIGSPMERTGKTKLAEVVLGVSITGKRTPAMQLGDREEEREKRIMSVLVRGQGLLHLDNLSEFLDSPSLASLLTSSTYQGRILGSSSSPEIPNGLTVVGTGNNVHATGEIAKRIVPIRLLPTTDAPEDRVDFRHPDLFGYVTANRERVLAALGGFVEHWKAQGRPLHKGGFGGFERWTAVTGGILNAAGYPEWLTNMKDWRGEVDDTNQEFAEFVTVWSRGGTESTPLPVTTPGHPGAWVNASVLYKLAIELDLFGFLDRISGERGKKISFGRRVLTKLKGRPVGQWRVEDDGVGSKRQARLVAVGQGKVQA